MYAKKFKRRPRRKAPKMRRHQGLRRVAHVRVHLVRQRRSRSSFCRALSQLTATETDGAYAATLGSFGALMARALRRAQLAARAAAQRPRRLHAAATISILFYYLSGPEFANALPKWAAQALAPATAIAVSQRFNLLRRPPAPSRSSSSRAAPRPSTSGGCTS